MMIHESIQCANCQQEVKWFYPIPSRISDGVPVAYSKPKDKLKLIENVKYQNQNIYLKLNVITADR